MDPVGLAGLLIGIGALLLGQGIEGGSARSLLQPAAAVIVFGGTLGATLLSAPSSDAREAWRGLRRAFRRTPRRAEAMLAMLMKMATTARRNGLIALENFAGLERQPFLARAIRHAVDGTNGTVLREILDTEVRLQSERQLAAARVFESAGGYAPTIGILGAVLGLIHVMRHLGEPEKLGAGIAVAFVATLYGVGFANLVCLPIGRRLRRLAEADRLLLEMIVEGAIAIQAGQSPRAVEARLESYVRAERETMRGRP